MTEKDGELRNACINCGNVIIVSSNKSSPNNDRPATALPVAKPALKTANPYNTSLAATDKDENGNSGIPSSNEPSSRRSGPHKNYGFIENEGIVIKIRHIQEQIVTGRGTLSGFGAIWGHGGHVDGVMSTTGSSSIDTRHRYCTEFFTRDEYGEDTQFIINEAAPPILEGHRLLNTFVGNKYGELLWASTFNFNTNINILHVNEHEVCRHLDINRYEQYKMPATKAQMEDKERFMRGLSLFAHSACVLFMCVLLASIIMALSKRADSTVTSFVVIVTVVLGIVTFTTYVIYLYQLILQRTM